MKHILSLFDGMSCLQQALQRANITYDNYYASEIDKFAIQVTQKNYPNTIQLGSVINVNGYDFKDIFLLAGGSPCQSFSFAGKRKGMSTKCEIEITTLEQYLTLKKEGYEFEGQSYLFWEYVRILKEVNPKYFLLENVMMAEKWERIISNTLGVAPIMINSAKISAQNRKRLYWTNIGLAPGGLFGELYSTIKQPKDKGILLKDILESEVDEKYYLSEKALKFITDETRLNKKYTQIDGEKALPHLARSPMNWCGTSITCHNMMPRSSTNGNGGTGHLTRNDGKTYCLDTQQSNAVEIVAMRGRVENNIQQLELNGTQKRNSLTTVQKDNLVLGCDYRKDEGIRYKANEKSGTLAARAREDESCGQLASINTRIRRLTPIECERLQTVNDNYTSCVSDSQRYKMLGNGWTIDVITHILNYI